MGMKPGLQGTGARLCTLHRACLLAACLLLGSGLEEEERGEGAACMAVPTSAWFSRGGQLSRTARITQSRWRHAKREPLL